MSSVSFEHNGNTYCKYIEPDPHTIYRDITRLIGAFTRFLKITNDDITNYHIDIGTLTKVFVRVDQRRLHYKMYHEGLLINELKYVAIVCYWLMRYQPIVRVNVDDDVRASMLERFCLQLIFATVKQYRAIRRMPFAVIDQTIFDDIFYYFRHRQHSYDSLVLFVETMARTL